MGEYSAMSPGNSSRPADNILRVIDEFEQGTTDVERLQSALEACAAALDNSSRDVLDELRRVEADPCSTMAPRANEADLASS